MASVGNSGALPGDVSGSPQGVRESALGGGQALGGSGSPQGAVLGAAPDAGRSRSPHRGQDAMRATLATAPASEDAKTRSRSPRRADGAGERRDQDLAYTVPPTSAHGGATGAEPSAHVLAGGSPRHQSESPREEAAGARIPLYSEVNPGGWVARVVGKNSMGSPTICIYDNVTRTTPEFCLYKGDECGTLVFQLEPRKDAERPAFMTGAEPTKKVESLDLTITLEGDQLAFARQVDERCKKMALDNSREWFGRTCTATEIDVMYTSPVKVDETGRWAPHLRARMNLGGIDRYLTQVTYVRANDTPEEGCGWDFVEPRLGEQKWRGHRARMVLEARRIWIVNRKFGLTYSIRDIAVRERPQKRATPFTCDNSVECLGALSA